MDQAEKLRQIIAAQQNKNEKSTEARIIAVTSGKGGVGKTNFTINIALALRALGKRVTIIDADLGLANVDVLLGVLSKYSFLDVLSGKVEAKDLVEEGPDGLKIVSGGSGLTDLVNIDDVELERLIYALSYFNSISDFILIDTGAGISKSVLSFVEAASEIIVILNPDPTSITDAYALIKNISNIEEKEVRLVINRVESALEGREAFSKISNTVERFLNIKIENLGYIFEDYNLGKAVKQQMPVLKAYPRSLSSKAIEEIARNLVNGKQTEQENRKGLFGFLKRLAKI
ncbi:MAG: MinD/ParA family protein [Bacillota bacterium]|nr:MinD/ParA family protein [Bacillota bacterium]